uniref:Uncharacterized protein LOC113791874 n=1 Tax=Dermatophagoides pteronyssinus TaxID=6956 RepID=A0A6P6XWG0_DERPT|nr:uncharacterized protein LOC113791874 [Dermatophagoides pteronyssinus]
MYFYQHIMSSSMNFNYIFLSCIILLAFIIAPVQSLKCFICHTNDNEQCELQDCPADQAYDRCMTTLFKNPSDGRNIKKECALAPCHLRGLQHWNFANFKSNCESSKQDDCIYCCTKDGCNKDSAITLMANAPRIINVIFLCLIVSLLSSFLSTSNTIV